MKTFFDDVELWHRDILKEEEPLMHLPTDREWVERVKLILEELSETADALALGDMIGFVDGLADLTFVVLGTAVISGLPFNEIWEEIRQSNMSKAGGKKDSSNKFIKPSTYKPADIASILKIKKLMDSYPIVKNDLNKKFNNEADHDDY